MWCIAKFTPEYLERMYQVIDLYNEPYDPTRPVLCFDEKSIQIQAHFLDPYTQTLSHSEHGDDQYQRLGTLNCFVMVEPKSGNRIIQLTKQRRKVDFAYAIQLIVEQYLHDPKVKFLRIVVDNLNTHNNSSLYENFPQETASKLAEKIIWVYTPKHGSWLNMAENEIGVYSQQCLNRRFDSIDHLIQESQAWVDDRNRLRVCIDWTFSRKEAEDLYAQIIYNDRESDEFLSLKNNWEQLVDVKTRIDQEKAERRSKNQEKKKKRKLEGESVQSIIPVIPVTQVKDRLVNLDPKNDYPLPPKSFKPAQLRARSVSNSPLTTKIILAFLTAVYPLPQSVKDLCRELNVKRSTLYPYVKRLLEQGLIKKKTKKSTKKGRPTIIFLIVLTPASDKGPP